MQLPTVNLRFTINQNSASRTLSSSVQKHSSDGTNLPWASFHRLNSFRFLNETASSAKLIFLSLRKFVNSSMLGTNQVPMVNVRILLLYLSIFRDFICTIQSLSRISLQ